MCLGGSVTADTINLDAYGSTTAIALGGADASNTLGLTAAELKTLHTEVLNIGTDQARTGTTTVGGGGPEPAATPAART
jgi:hypothetical protein